MPLVEVKLKQNIFCFFKENFIRKIEVKDPNSFIFLIWFWLVTKEKTISNAALLVGKQHQGNVNVDISENKESSIAF